jgi:hypothetical protein
MQTIYIPLAFDYERDTKKIEVEAGELSDVALVDERGRLDPGDEIMPGATLAEVIYHVQFAWINT